MDLNCEEIVGTFYEKELRKTNQEVFRIKKVVKRKQKNYLSKGNDVIIHLILGLIKKTLYENESILSKTI